MPFQPLPNVERHRELRRRVQVQARISTGGEMADARILNVSSRGLMIRSACDAPEGALIRLLRGNQIIPARVVWRDGANVGLRAEERIAVEEVMSLDQSVEVTLNATTLDGREIRLARARSGQRERGRSMEFLGLGAIIIALAIAAFLLAAQALGPPLAEAAAALGN